MTPEDFNPNHFNRNEKYAFDLDVPTVQGLTLPILLIKGKGRGRTLVITAGVHGDEYEGVRAILDVYEALNPAEMAGDVLCVPVANPLAFWKGSRTTPCDGLNLARVFPGRVDASPTASIAHCIANSIIARADFFVDLHSAGVKLLMPTMIGYDANDVRSRNAAFIFGAPVLWGHPDMVPGRTISFAKSMGIPWLYTEARGAGRIHESDLFIFKRGILNLLSHLGIVPGEPQLVQPSAHLFGNGDIDSSLLSNKPGFLIQDTQLLQAVSAGEQLGHTVNLHGEIVEIFRSPSDGVVALIRQWPVVEPGEPMFLVTGTYSP
jgi:predicted deacylase